MTTTLKALLVERHMQSHSAFVHEYDKAAAAVDPAFVGKAPGRAQYFRWLAGTLTELPYAHHRRVLEQMFPGRTAAELFAPAGSFRTPAAESTGSAETCTAYATRAALMHAMPPDIVFDSARCIRMAGLSLNVLCQQYPDTALVDLVERGATIRCLFLDPDGEQIRIREDEEGHDRGILTTLTRLNISTLQRLQAKLSADALGELTIRVYDETVRFNITLVDERLGVVQPYLPDARGVESPTLVFGGGGMFATFARVWESMWERTIEP